MSFLGEDNNENVKLSIFNSRLFFDFSENDEEKSISVDNTEGTENPNEIEELNDDYHLLNGIIDELDSNGENSSKKENRDKKENNNLVKSEKEEATVQEKCEEIKEKQPSLFFNINTKNKFDITFTDYEKSTKKISQKPLFPSNNSLTFSPSPSSLSSSDTSSAVNSLLNLINNGYEFHPKNYKPKESIITPPVIKKFNKYNTSSNNHSNSNTNGKKAKSFQEREGDWVCSVCRNLNFSFRKTCNRCKISKIESFEQKNNKYICNNGIKTERSVTQSDNNNTYNGNNN